MDLITYLFPQITKEEDQHVMIKTTVVPSKRVSQCVLAPKIFSLWCSNYDYLTR